MTLYQTKLAVWPYLPKLNSTHVEHLEALVDVWFISGAPLGAAIPCQHGFPVDEVRAVTFSFLCNYSRNTGL